MPYCRTVLIIMIALASANCSSVWSNKTPTAPEALEVLRSSEFFNGPCVGLLCVASDEACALKAIMTSPNREEYFRELYGHENLTPRLYALCGLYFVDREYFERALDELASSDGDEIVGRVEFDVGFGSRVDALLFGSKGEPCPISDGCLPVKFLTADCRSR